MRAVLVRQDSFTARTNSLLRVDEYGEISGVYESADGVVVIHCAPRNRFGYNAYYRTVIGGRLYVRHEESYLKIPSYRALAVRAGKWLRRLVAQQKRDLGIGA